MGEIPRAVLSEKLQEQMKGRVLKTAVFLTFRFDPGFFEQEILPVFLDVAPSHLPPVRLTLLEDAISERVDHLAVYYDARALTGDEGPRLDVRRVPVSWPNGYFHPKNVFLLVQDAKSDDDGNREERLLVAALSANLTQAGWWQNVEVCHIEELRLDQKSSLCSDLVRLFRRVQKASPPDEAHLALQQILRFVSRVEERSYRSSEGIVHPRLYIGQAEGTKALESVPDFLADVLPRKHTFNLEVISPYFDNTDEARPLAALVRRFAPEEVRVYLPRDIDKKALCRQPYYDAVRKLPNTHWGRLPEDLLSGGASASALPRTVHAKVYRFFSRSPRYEAFFVGSVNLTGAAHIGGSNLETAFFVEREPKGQPDWWLSVDASRPTEFYQAAEEEGLSQGPGWALVVVYDWERGTARVLWDQSERSPALKIHAQGTPLFDVGPLPSRKWTHLAPEQGEALKRILTSTSLLTVEVEGLPPAIILVQEEGMVKKPPILLNLSISDILRCWASLTPEQKALLYQVRYEEIAKVASALLPAKPLGHTEADSVFDAFAGIFHAFAALERKVLEALGAGREKEAVHLLFGRKHESLPRLLGRVLDEEKELDNVNRYVMLLCARQVVSRARQDASAEFRVAHRRDFDEIEDQLSNLPSIREAFTFGSATERSSFFDWFDAWFLKRAEPMPVGQR